MGSARPARRFDALRALTKSDLPNRLAPDGGPPCAFAPLQRSITAPPHRPARPKARNVGRCFLPWTLAPYDTCRDGGPAFRGASGPAACRVRGFDPHRGVHHRPSRRLSAPERPWASPFKAFSPSRSGLLPEPPALLALLESIRLALMRACGHGRLQGLDPATGSFCPSGSRRTRRVDAFLGFFPPEHSLPPALASALGRGGSPLTRWAGRRHRSACVTGFQSSEGSVWPLSGLPALVGFLTFRPSRRRCDPRGERAHGFTSRARALQARDPL
jgi:hypothetical protein